MTDTNKDTQELVELLNREVETLHVGSEIPPRRARAPTEQEQVVSGEGLPEEQFLHCRATKGCEGKLARKIQDVHLVYGRLLRFQCLTCNRSWSLTL